MKTNFIIILLISFFSSGIYAQLDDNVKAKLYFTEAQKLFEQGDFKNSLVYVDKAETTLGKAVARTLALRLKIEFNSGNFIMAKELFDEYTNNYMDGASKELNDEVLAMFIDIEEAEEAEKKRKDQQQAEEERRKAAALAAEEWRKAEIERQRLEAAQKAEEERLKAVELDKNPYIIVNGRKLEIAKDLGIMSWHKAKDVCKELGSGWRLPTKSELSQMYYELYLNGRGNFKSVYYWSSTEYSPGVVYVFDFSDGSAAGNLKRRTGYVIAVRAL